MIETVTGEEEYSNKKSYQRLTDDPIYSIEEKIDRMLMGKELSLAERFQRKFGEDLELDTGSPLSSYTPRDLDSDGPKKKGEGKKGPIPKDSDDDSKKGKKSRKDKKAEKAEKGEKKASRFGGLKKKGGGKAKAKKGPSVADLMGSKVKAKTKAKPKKKGLSVADLMKKPAVVEEPEEEPEEEPDVEGELDYDDFSTFKTVVDSLLENLPEDIVETFMASDDFGTYERVGTADDFSDEDDNYIKIVDNLLEKLPEDIVNEFMESDNFELYQKIVEWGSE